MHLLRYQMNVLFLQLDHGILKKGMPFIHKEGDIYTYPNSNMEFHIPSYMLHKKHPLEDVASGYLFVDKVSVLVDENILDGTHSCKVILDHWPLNELVVKVPPNLTQKDKTHILNIAINGLERNLSVCCDVNYMRGLLNNELNKMNNTLKAHELISKILDNRTKLVKDIAKDIGIGLATVYSIYNKKKKVTDTVLNKLVAYTIYLDKEAKENLLLEAKEEIAIAKLMKETNIVELKSNVMEYVLGLSKEKYMQAVSELVTSMLVNKRQIDLAKEMNIGLKTLQRAYLKVSVVKPVILGLILDKAIEMRLVAELKALLDPVSVDVDPPEEEVVEKCSSKMDLDVNTYYRRLSRGVKTNIVGTVLLAEVKKNISLTLKELRMHVESTHKTISSSIATSLFEINNIANRLTASRNESISTMELESFCVKLSKLSKSLNKPFILGVF